MLNTDLPAPWLLSVTISNWVLSVYSKKWAWLLWFLWHFPIISIYWNFMGKTFWTRSWERTTAPALTERDSNNTWTYWKGQQQHLNLLKGQQHLHLLKGTTAPELTERTTAPALTERDNSTCTYWKGQQQHLHLLKGTTTAPALTERDNNSTCTYWKGNCRQT